MMLLFHCENCIEVVPERLYFRYFKCYNRKDAMNGSISLDTKSTKEWYPLDPRFNVMKLDTPFAMSDHIAIPKPVIGSMGYWLDN